MELTQQQARKSLNEHDTFTAWLAQVSPRWPWHYTHLEYIRAHLQRVTGGECKRLMIFLPPRHYKSEMVTVRYSAWRLECDPSMRVIVGAYNQLLADKFSRKARRIVETRIPLAKDRQAVQDWETQEGGGLRAVGVGSGITGQGGELVIIDDPVKSREEAQSEVYREKVWDWYTDDIYTRLEADSAVILIMTRWHEDDLAGRILASEQAGDWTVCSLPAEAEEGDPLGREVGEPLCPEKFDKAALADRRAVLGNSYYALYQQRPQPKEGDMFKAHWFKIVRAVPSGTAWVRYWDNAGTAGGGDYSAGVLMGRTPEGRFIVADVVRGQWSPHERESMKQLTAAQDAETYGRVVIWNEQEPGSAGKESAATTIRNLAGYAVYAETATGDKVTRAEPFAAQCEAGNVDLLSGPWNGKYLGELTAFPNGKRKDQVDGSSGAFNKLAQVSAGVFF